MELKREIPEYEPDLPRVYVILFERRHYIIVEPLTERALVVAELDDRNGGV